MLKALSSAEAPKGWRRWIGEKEGARGTTGRGKSEELFPLPSVPRALSRKSQGCGRQSVKSA